MCSVAASAACRYGVVEADFFDWVIEVDGGEEFVRALARRLGRFDWSHVEQDVMKVLYETVIGAETRKRLGEYYTPDWLAEAMVDKVVTDPLNQRVLDTARGSGTFLFHAIRRYIAEAHHKKKPLADILDGVTRHVIGMDLHPVAVTFARVTYLLAIGREHLTHVERGTIQVPVYLGDSMQWQEQQLDLLKSGNLVIRADDTIDTTFKTMCRLHDERRDHIWGYYVRNPARPVWLSRDTNRVDVLVGNPPWLAYRHMTNEMQKAFRNMSAARGLWAGADVATHQDLSALFVVRASELYLKKGGQFGLVMLNAAVDRQQYVGFRSGDYDHSEGTIALSISGSWDLRRIRPHFFPRGASVVFGSRVNEAVMMPEETELCELGNLLAGSPKGSAPRSWHSSYLKGSCRCLVLPFRVHSGRYDVAPAPLHSREAKVFSARRSRRSCCRDIIDQQQREGTLEEH